MLMQAARKVPDYIREYVRLSHKLNPLPSDPRKIDIKQVIPYLVPSKNWTVRELISLVRTYVKYGIRRLNKFADRVGKSSHSAQRKLVHLGTYNNVYQGIEPSS